MNHAAAAAAMFGLHEVFDHSEPVLGARVLQFVAALLQWPALALIAAAMALLAWSATR